MTAECSPHYRAWRHSLSTSELFLVLLLHLRSLSINDSSFNSDHGITAHCSPSALLHVIWTSVCLNMICSQLKCSTITYLPLVYSVAVHRSKVYTVQLVDLKIIYLHGNLSLGMTWAHILLPHPHWTKWRGRYLWYSIRLRIILRYLVAEWTAYK